MAQLTSELQGSSNRVRVQDPGPRGPGILEGLARTGQTILSGLGDVEQARAANRQARADGVLDQLASAALNDTVREAENIRLPAGVEQGVRRLESVRASAAQGRASQTQVRTELERFVLEAQRDYPDQMYEIMTAVGQRGWDHYLFRDVALQREAQDSERAAMQQAETEAYNFAVENISPDNLGSSYDEVATQGAYLRAEQAALERTRAAAAEARAAAEEGRSATRFQREEANTAAYQAATSHIAASVGPALSRLQSEISSGALPPGQGRLSRGLEIQRVIQEARTQALSNLAGVADSSTINAVNTQLDSLEEALNSIIVSDNAQDIIGVLENQIGLNVMEAVPGYAVGRAVLGEENMVAVLSPQVQAAFLEGGVYDSVASTIVNGSVTDGALARYGQSFNNIDNGNYTAEDVEAVGPAVRVRLQNSSRRVSAGEEEAFPSFLRDYRANLNLAQDTFQVGMTNGRAALSAASDVFSPRILENLSTIGSPAVNQAALAEAEAALFSLTRSSLESNIPAGGGAVRFNPDTGQYEAGGRGVQNPRARQALGAAFNAAMSQPGTRGALMLQQNASANNSEAAAQAANMILDFMVQLDTREGMTNLEKRADYAGVELNEQ